jgi:hypothetical protein
VTDVEVAVGIGQGGGDEKLARRHVKQDLLNKGANFSPRQSSL